MRASAATTQREAYSMTRKSNGGTGGLVNPLVVCLSALLHVSRLGNLPGREWRGTASTYRPEICLSLLRIPPETGILAINAPTS